MEKKTVILELGDGISSTKVLVKTDKSQDEIEKMLQDIIDDFAEDEYIDWDYDELLEALEESGAIEMLPHETYYVHA